MAADKIRIRDLPILGRLCIFSEFFYGLCVGAWSIALNFHLDANGTSEAQTGMLLSAGYLVTAAASFFAGRLGDKKGFPFVMGTGALLMGSALFFIACVHRFSLFCLGHVIYCIGLACVMSMEYNLPLSLIYDNQRQYGYNMVLVFYFLGSIAGNFICSLCLPVFPDQSNPYRYILLICAASYGLLAFFRGKMPRQRREMSGPVNTDAQAYRTLLSSWKIRSYLLYGCLAFGLLTLSTGMLNMVLRLWHHMTDAEVALVFSCNSLTGFLTLVLVPALTLRFTLHNLSKAALTVQLLALIGMAFLPTGPLAGMIFLRTAFCNMLYSTVDSPMLQSVEPQLRGTYSGIRVFANYIGMSITAALSGWLVGVRAFQTLYLVCAGIALVQLTIYIFLCSRFLSPRGSVAC